MCQPPLLSIGKRCHWYPQGVTVGAIFLSACLGSGPIQDKGLNQLTERIRQESLLPNLYVTVVYGGKVYASAAGFQDPAKSKAATVQDRYRIGSVTKPLTSLLTLRLAAAGKIKLDDPFINCFPEVKTVSGEPFSKATVLNLLTHTSGLSGPGTGPHRGRAKDESLESYGIAARLECIPKWLSERPVGPIGEYVYSNNGYCILGSLCEKVGRASFASLMKSEVFDPLGMTGAGIGMPSAEESVGHPWYFPVRDGRPGTPFPPTPKHDQGPTAAPQGCAYWDSESAGRLMLEMIRLSRGSSQFLPRDLAKGVLSPQLGLKSRTLAWESWQEGRFGLALNHNGQNADHRGPWNITHTRILPSVGFGMSVTSTSAFSGNIVALSNKIQEFVLGQP